MHSLIMCPCMFSSGDPRLHRLVEAYRDHGHFKACLDPLGLVNQSVEPQALYSLDPQGFGLSDSEGDLSGLQELLPAFPDVKGSVSDVVDYLEHMYCGGISLQLAHVSVSTYVSKHT